MGGRLTNITNPYRDTKSPNESLICDIIFCALMMFYASYALSEVPQTYQGISDGYKKYWGVCEAEHEKTRYGDLP